MAIDLSQYFTETITCPHCRLRALQHVVANGPLDRTTVQRVRGGTLHKVYKTLECQNCKLVTLEVTTRKASTYPVGDPEVVQVDYYPPLPSRELPKGSRENTTEQSLIRDEDNKSLEQSP
jgi:hypothetical protein